jgi:hypothetical protein
MEKNNDFCVSLQQVHHEADNLLPGFLAMAYGLLVVGVFFKLQLVLDGYALADVFATVPDVLHRPEYQQSFEYCNHKCGTLHHIGHCEKDKTHHHEHLKHLMCSCHRHSAIYLMSN